MCEAQCKHCPNLDLHCRPLVVHWTYIVRHCEMFLNKNDFLVRRIHASPYRPILAALRTAHLNAMCELWQTLTTRAAREHALEHAQSSQPCSNFEKQNINHHHIRKRRKKSEGKTALCRVRELLRNGVSILDLLTQ